MAGERGQPLQHHPDVHQPWSQWSEDQVLHLVIPYSNPWRWRTRRELFNDCYRHFKNSPNVIPHRAEVAFGDRPFEVTGDDHNDLQLRTTDEMWLKENSINLAVSKLPVDWKYAGYVDADFHFTRHDWALEAVHLLQHYDFVQLFSTYADITGETATSWQGHRPYRLNSSFAWNYQHPEQFKAAQLARSKADPGYYVKPLASKQFPFGFWPGAPGGAWAWRRPAFEAVGGLLDTCILGSGDYHMAAALAKLPDTHVEMKLALPGYIRAIQEWRDRAGQLHANIGCVDNFAVHSWHGNKVSRGYGGRVDVLRNFQFDPYRDIQRDWQGLWKWDGRKPQMRDAARRFFLDRNEDEATLRDAKGPLV
jgi:hypothetical protein